MLGPRAYQARNFDAPSTLGDGASSVDLDDFFVNICRGQDPNIPGFSLASRLPEYSLWPFHRYGALVAEGDPAWFAASPFRLIPEVRGLDARKKSIVAEDIGIGFALDACNRLNGLPVITKWEAAQEVRRAGWALMLMEGHGLDAIDAVNVSASLGKTLAGADFVGYSSSELSWLICESKGSLKAPPAAGGVNAALANPWPPSSTGSPVPARAPLLHGIQQKLSTGDAARAARVPVMALLVYSSAAFADDRRDTTVDYIDPDPTPEQVSVLREFGHVAADFIATAHYDWVSRVLGLPVSLWGHDLAVVPPIEVAGIDVPVALPRRARLDLVPGVSMAVVIGMAAEVVEILRARDLVALRRWQMDRGPFRSDGLIVRTVVDDDDRPFPVARPGDPGRGRGPVGVPVGKTFA